jgi:arsenate reductase
MDIFLKTIGSINDESRLKILNFIHQTGEVCVCDIENAFDMIQSRVSRHLKILKEAGFLRVERRGRWAYYSIRSPLDAFRTSILEEIKYLNIELPTLKDKGCKMNKKVLILCTGNSCRSIIAEALINAELEGIDAESSGVKASGRVNPNAKKLLEEKGIWRDTYHSKTLDTVINNDYDLVVTVCDHAHETCPMFPKPVKTIHVGFEDPDGKGFEAFEETYKEIKNELLPKIKKELA